MVDYIRYQSAEPFDVFVIGGGAAGSEVVGQLTARGDLRVGMAERDHLGGECDWYGCVPTKTMLRSAKLAALLERASGYGIKSGGAQVDFAAVRLRVMDVIAKMTREGPSPFTDKGATVLFEDVRVRGPGELETSSGARVRADRIVLATGTEAVIPPIPGLGDGPFWTNKEAIWHSGGVPGSLIVLGGGAIGVEFAQIYARFGAKVTLVESTRTLLPAEDATVGARIEDVLEADGIRILTSATVTNAQHGPDGWRLGLKDGGTLRGQELLVAVGRRPVFDGHDLDGAGVKLDEEGKPVLDDSLRTTAPNIWVAGDATGDLLFTHVADYEAGIVAKDISGEPESRDYRVVPKVTYTDPEIASVGLSEEEAIEAGRDIVTSLVSLRDDDRTVIDDVWPGQVKVVADARSGEVLGGSIVSERAGDMISEIALAVADRIPAAEAARVIHAYPTSSSAIRRALTTVASQAHG